MTMNKFEKISEGEYDKTVLNEFKIKNGVLDYTQYDDLTIPHRATSKSAGYDFYSPISFVLKPNQSIKVPTCIKCQLEDHCFLMLVPRSSYGFKYRMQLDNTIGIIDADYYNNESNEGHIYIKITNDNKEGKNLQVNKGDAFAQGIILKFEVSNDGNITAQRVGGIGSTSMK